MDRLLYNFSSCKFKEEKRTLCNLKFSVTGWEKLKSSEKEKLTDTAQNLFHLLTEFAKLKKKNSRNNCKHLLNISCLFL